MNTNNKTYYKQELQHIRRHLTNIRTTMTKETTPPNSTHRMNHDARMHQISGLFRHIGYLETYIDTTETEDTHP